MQRSYSDDHCRPLFIVCIYLFIWPLTVFTFIVFIVITLLPLYGLKHWKIVQYCYYCDTIPNTNDRERYCYYYMYYYYYCAMKLLLLIQWYWWLLMKKLMTDDLLLLLTVGNYTMDGYYYDRSQWAIITDDPLLLLTNALLIQWYYDGNTQLCENQWYYEMTMVILLNDLTLLMKKWPIEG